MTIKNLLFIVVLTTATIALTNGNCDKCLTNGVQCINETSFYMCYGTNADKVDTSAAYNCEEGSVCTGLKIICAPKTDVSPACGGTTGCANCETNGFTCTSKSTFALCSGGSLTSVKGKCPSGLICDAGSTSSEICVLPCRGQPTCNIPDPAE